MAYPAPIGAFTNPAAGVIPAGHPKPGDANWTGDWKKCPALANVSALPPGHPKPGDANWSDDWTKCPALSQAFAAAAAVPGPFTAGNFPPQLVAKAIAGGCPVFTGQGVAPHVAAKAAAAGCPVFAPKAPSAGVAAPAFSFGGFSGYQQPVTTPAFAGFGTTAPAHFGYAAPVAHFGTVAPTAQFGQTFAVTAQAPQPTFGGFPTYAAFAPGATPFGF